MLCNTKINVVNIGHIINAPYIDQLIGVGAKNNTLLETLISNMLTYSIECGRLPNESGEVNISLEQELLKILESLNIELGVKCEVNVTIINDIMHLVITS